MKVEKEKQKKNKNSKGKAYQLDWFLHVHRPLQNLDGYFEGQKPARKSIMQIRKNKKHIK